MIQVSSSSLGCVGSASWQGVYQPKSSSGGGHACRPPLLASTCLGMIIRVHQEVYLPSDEKFDVVIVKRSHICSENPVFDAVEVDYGSSNTNHYRSCMQDYQPVKAPLHLISCPCRRNNVNAMCSNPSAIRYAMLYKSYSMIVA